MKRALKTVLIIILTLSVSIPTYAGSDECIRQTREIASDKSIVENDNISKIIAIPKGRLLSSAGLQISDEGNGLLGVYAETLCHERAKQIFMTIYLDVWIESMQDWRTLDYYDYSWDVSNEPDSNLTMAIVSFDIEGLTKGYTYRLRGYHSARSFGLLSESMSTSTSGIVLD